MPDTNVLRALAVSALVALTACSQTDTGAASGAISSDAQLQDEPTFISALSMKFRREVRYVVNFGFDLDTLDAEARDKIAEQAVWIVSHRNVQFAVTGHTDKVGNNAYNQDLGLRRAQRVVDALIAEGVAPEQLIAMVTEGEEKPLINTEARERTNRRTVTDVLGYLDTTASVKQPPRKRKKPNPPEPDPLVPPPGPGPTDEFGNPLGQTIDNGPVLDNNQES